MKGGLVVGLLVMDALKECGERLPMEATKDNYALAEHINQVCQKYGFGERIPEYLEAESLISSAKVLAATVVELPV